MKQVLLSVLMLLSLTFGLNAQVELARESFEDAGGHGYTTFPEECACCYLANVAFYKKKANQTSGCYPKMFDADGTYFWATENTVLLNDRNPGSPYADEAILQLNKVGITGYESLEVLFLAGHGLTGEVENTDYMEIQYAIDGDIAADNYTTVSQFFGFSTSNRTFEYDENADGILDGDTLSRNFKEFVADLGSVTGDTLSVRFVHYTNNFGEDTSLDNIRVQGVLAPLAVELLDFQLVAREEKAVAIHWTTLNEVNLSSYQLQRSTDGVNWSTIYDTSAKGAGEYSFQDHQIPYATTIYYRLRWIDFDGQLGYSAVRSFSPKHAFFVGDLFPNPLKGKQLQVNIRSKGKQVAQWALYNMVGQVQQSGSLNLHNGEEVYSLDLESLPSGMYYWQLNISDQQFAVSKRLMVIE